MQSLTLKRKNIQFVLSILKNQTASMKVLLKIVRLSELSHTTVLYTFFKVRTCHTEGFPDRINYTRDQFYSGRKSSLISEHLPGGRDGMFSCSQLNFPCVPVFPKNSL